MLSEEEVKQVAEELGKSIADGDKYGIIPSLLDYIANMRLAYKIDNLNNMTNKGIPCNIYPDNLIEHALEILQEGHVLFIQGLTGIGKTSLAYYLASQLTGCDMVLAEQNINLERICNYIATSGMAVYSDDQFTGSILNKFISYINYNNITEPCVFICNEVQTYGLQALFGEMYFSFSDKEWLMHYIPKNLYIICTGLAYHGLTIPLKAKLIQLEGLLQDNTVLHEKLLNVYGHLNSDLDNILNLAETMNSLYVKSPVISVRNLVTALNTKCLLLCNFDTINFTSSEDVYRILRELKETYAFEFKDESNKEICV